MAIFFNFSPTSNHLHPPQVENCDSNSRLVVDEDDNGKFRLEIIKSHNLRFYDADYCIMMAIDNYCKLALILDNYYILSLISLISVVRQVTLFKKSL